MTQFKGIVNKKRINIIFQSVKFKVSIYLNRTSLFYNNLAEDHLSL